MNEEWRRIPGFENHEVSNMGVVRRLETSQRRGHVFCSEKSTAEYERITLINGDKRRSCATHRLVYEVFKGRIPEGYVIDHINGDKHDNRASNLEAVTSQINSLRYRAIQYHLSIHANYQSKVQFWDIGAAINADMPVLITILGRELFPTRLPLETPDDDILSVFAHDETIYESDEETLVGIFLDSEHVNIPISDVGRLIKALEYIRDNPPKKGYRR